MIWLAWIGLAAADPLDERLLGPEPPVPEARAPATPDLASSWPLALGALGLGALWWGRGKLRLPSSLAREPELRVVGRTALGGGAGLAVVEVRGSDGGWRRLVIGTGTGSPSLVVDLGSASFDEALEAAEVEEPPHESVVREILGERKIRSSVTTVA